MIEKFRSLGQPFFYSIIPGENALDYNKQQLDEMSIDNYRSIEYKLKKGLYLKFTHEHMKASILTVDIYNQLASSNGSYAIFNNVDD